MGATLLTLAVVTGLLAGFLYLVQPAMVFFPTRQLAETPADWGMDFEDVWITAEDGVRLHGWYLPHPGARRTLLFFHGNAGNISHRQTSIAIFHRLGLNVLSIDYRGYGQSDGRPSETGLYRDAAATWDYLLRQRGVQAANVVVFGRSLGGAVAVRLAAEVQPAALIVESTFSSARDAIRAFYPGLHWLIVSRFGFDSAARLATVRCPVLVLHSPEDEIIPYTLGREVYEAAREPKAFVALRGDHNRGFLLSQPDYERALAAFIARLPAGREEGL